MSMPLEPQVIEPPPPYLNQEAYSSHSGFGHVGPLIGVLAVITILGVLAGMVGRLCAGRTIMGYGQYDFEGWIERKCASCIDGRIDSRPPPRQPSANGGASDSVPVPMPVENPEATTAPKQSDRSPPRNQAEAGES